MAVAPVGDSKLKRAARTTEGEGVSSIVLKPTRAGLRELRRTGELKVRARFTFTPCGAPASKVVHSYTPKMR